MYVITYGNKILNSTPVIGIFYSIFSTSHWRYITNKGMLFNICYLQKMNYTNQVVKYMSKNIIFKLTTYFINMTCILFSMLHKTFKFNMHVELKIVHIESNVHLLLEYAANFLKNNINIHIPLFYNKNFAKRLLKRQCSNLPPSLNQFGAIGIVSGCFT